MIIRVSGQFTQLLYLWLTGNRLSAPALKKRLAHMAQRDTVPVEDWRAALSEAAKMAPHGHFGLDVGAQVSLNHVGLLGFLVSNSESLADGLQVYQLFERRFYSVNFAELTCTDNRYTLSWRDQLGDSNGLFVQVALATLVTFLRQRFPSTFKLEAVALTEAAAVDARPYTEFFGCPVSFASSQPGISVNLEFASQPETQLLPAAYRAVQNQQSEAFSSAIDSGAPFLRSLQPLLLNMLPRGDVSLAAVAREVKCSPRTLQRRLSQYNFSYQSLLDAVREQLACRYLQDSNLGYVEMALLLGFSEQSAFNRAFKKWTGVPPGAYRR